MPESGPHDPPRERRGRVASGPSPSLSEVALLSHYPALRYIGTLGMRRRDFMTVLAVAAGYPHLAGAQQKAMPVIGLLSPLTPADTEPWHRAFRQGLGDLGWVAGANLKLEYRYSNGQNERLPELVAEPA